MELVRIFFDEFKDQEEKISNNHKDLIDNITWNDLSMDDVFNEINHTQSYIGEQVLYKRLHEPDAGRDWHSFEEQITYLQQHPRQRARIEKMLSKIGKREESYYLPQFLKHTELWKIQNGFLYHILQMLLLGFGVIGMITKNDIFLAGLLAVAAVNLLVYLWVKNKYEIYLYSLSSVKQLTDFCKKMISVKEWKSIFDSEEIEEAVHALGKVSKGIGNFESRKRVSWSGEPMALLQDYLLGITLYDVSGFNHIMKALDQKQDKLLVLYQFAGEIDMINAVAEYRERTVGECGEHICVPEFGENTDEFGEAGGYREEGEGKLPGRASIYMQGLRHPLLKHAVPNDFQTAGCVLISGANASGKSTFMKAAAINVILAQTIHTCTAQTAKMPPLLVMTSMALRDDILTGESYYIKEVRYLKRMLDEIEKGKPVLCVVDEMLKGTNTKERLAASEAILKYFAEKKCFVMAATHDMELIEKMQEFYECWYFESKVEEQDIRFDYVLHKGVGGRSNAVALLELLGFPAEIVDRARGNLGNSR